MTLDPLQIGLWLLAGLVLAAVWFYNRWVARRLLPRRSAAVPGASVDPVLTDGLASPTASTADCVSDDRFGREPGLEPAPDAAGLPGPASGMDARLDAIVPLVLDSGGVVSGDAVLAALPGTRRVGSKPFAVEGLHATHQHWEVPRAGQRYTALRTGLQLANRLGPLNEIEFSEYVVKVQAFADAVGAAAEFPEMMEEVARARELDQFAGAHDAQLTFTLCARRAAWSPGYLVQHAAALGFVAGALPGRMVLSAGLPGGTPVLVLQYETQLALAEDPEQVSLRECHLSLDVPHVGREERPFVRLRETGLQLAASMEGLVTDGAGHVLAPEDLDRIGADLEALYEALAARDLPAGSALAKRLFS